MNEYEQNYEEETFEKVPVKKEYRTISIYTTDISKMVPCFTASDVTIEICYMGEVLGMSSPVPITDDDPLVIPFEVQMQIWPLTDVKTIDDLISNPILFTVRQCPGKYELEAYPPTSVASGDPEALCEELEEIVGVSIPKPKEENVKMKGKLSKSTSSKKESKEKISNKSSGSKKDSKKDKTSSKTKIKKDTEPEDECRIVGNCSLDFFPFFTGKTKLNESLVVYQPEVYEDDRLVTFENLPRLNVEVTIDFPIFDEDFPLGNIMKFTIESMYNIPDDFGPFLEYQVATEVPGQKDFEAAVFKNGLFTNDYDPRPYKKWENLANVENRSRFMADEIVKKPEGIKNKLRVNLNEAFENKLENNPSKVEWNIMTRTWFTAEMNNKFRSRLIRNRRWPLEYKINMAQSADKIKDTKGNKGSKSSKDSIGSKKSKKALKFEPMHLMSFVDVSNLLYPGITKSRVIAEVRTYQELEMKKETSTDYCLFEPKTEKLEAEVVKVPKAKEKGKKDKKDKKSKKDTNTTKSTTKQLDNMSEDITDPSEPLSGENGEPTFVIIEMELLEPLFPKRTLDDYTKEYRFLLLSILPIREQLPKYALAKEVSSLKLDECMKSIIVKLCEDYQTYSFGTNQRKIQNASPTLPNFYDFLLHTGNYQDYLNSLLKTVTLYVAEHFDLEGSQKTHRQYGNFVSSIYVHLVGRMNKIINGPIMCGLDTPKVTPKQFGVSYVYRAREAEEIGIISLAERYHHEQLSQKSQDPDVWLNYSVFQLSLNDRDRAYECVKECLALQLNHKHGLLLYAVMLFIRKEWYYSETTFLTLLNYYPRYVEGWVCLYVFYLARENHAGCDVCEERIDSLPGLADPQNPQSPRDELFSADDIAWTTDIYPKRNKFFQTCMILLKMRMTSFAGLTMGYVPFPESGELKYYNAVLRYLTKDYENALLYLKQARKEHGPDFAVNSLLGHCYYRLGQFEKAKEAYEFVVLSFNRPDDMHLLYLNLAFIYDKENNPDMTKKYLLHVVKYSPTAYDWLLLGICYFKEESWTYCEECLTEANLEDCYIPETWAYLTLLNLKIGKPWVAAQCYQQMMKYDLQNEWLFGVVEKEMRKEKDNY